MEDITFKLNVKESNLIAKVLGERPYREVAVLLSKMQNQADEQSTNPQTAAPQENTPEPEV